MPCPIALPPPVVLLTTSTVVAAAASCSAAFCKRRWSAAALLISLRCLCFSRILLFCSIWLVCCCRGGGAATGTAPVSVASTVPSEEEVEPSREVNSGVPGSVSSSKVNSAVLRKLQFKKGRVTGYQVYVNPTFFNAPDFGGEGGGGCAVLGLKLAVLLKALDRSAP